VCAEKRRHQLHRVVRRCIAQRFQLLQLRLERQSVAALGLDRRRAQPQHRVEPLADPRRQLLAVGLPRAGDRGEDAAAPRRDALAQFPPRTDEDDLRPATGNGRVLDQVQPVQLGAGARR
jgi:hypothetical protein